MYAQILKENMQVILIGGATEGLPIDHPDVICIEIGNRTDVKVYMKYDEVTGVFSEEIPEPIIARPEEQRELAYETMLYKEGGIALIDWQGTPITVDQANFVYLQYSAEGSVKAAEIQSLISAAKEYIRNLYPDEVI